MEFIANIIFNGFRQRLISRLVALHNLSAFFMNNNNVIVFVYNFHGGITRLKCHSHDTKLPKSFDSATLRIV